MGLMLGSSARPYDARRAVAHTRAAVATTPCPIPMSCLQFKRHTDPALEARRYPGGYPHDPVNLRLAESVGLATADARALSKALHASAEAHAREDAVCVFDLVDTCQEFLRERNEAPAGTCTVCAG